MDILLVEDSEADADLARHSLNRYQLVPSTASEVVRDSALPAIPAR